MTKAEQVRATLGRFFPELESDGFGHAIYWKSMDQLEPGDRVEHGEEIYRVLHGWKWISYYGVNVYCHEVEPEPEDD